jgi:hypothetical protein
MEQSPSLEANRFSASQEIPLILWNPKVYYRSYKCTPCLYPLIFYVYNRKYFPCDCFEGRNKYLAVESVLFVVIINIIIIIVTIIIIIRYLSWSWATCCPVSVSRIQ